jgi:WD40 repeat protein
MNSFLLCFYMETSSDDTLVVASAAADETIRFWNVFSDEKGKKKTEIATTSVGLKKTGKMHMR